MIMMITVIMIMTMQCRCSEQNISNWIAGVSFSWSVIATISPPLPRWLKSHQVLMFLNQLQTFFMCFPQTIYFIAMVFGVMTFGILSDIVGRKKARSTSTIFTIFSCSSHRPHDRAPKQIFRSNIMYLSNLTFPLQVLIPLLVCMSISGIITSYMQSWKNQRHALWKGIFSSYLLDKLSW